MSVKVAGCATVASSSIGALSTLVSWGSVLLGAFTSGLRTVVGTSGLTIAECCLQGVVSVDNVMGEN